MFGVWHGSSDPCVCMLYLRPASRMFEYVIHASCVMLIIIIVVIILLYAIGSLASRRWSLHLVAKEDGFHGDGKP